MSDHLRFFVPPELLRQGEVIELSGDTLHHMQHVLRLQEETEVLLLDGSGLCCLTRLESFSRHRAQGRVLKRWQASESALPVEILQALPKGDRFDLVLQKGTELGVTAFQPLLTARSVPRAKATRLASRAERWQRIVRESARQSQRAILPEVRPVRPLDEVLDSASAASLKLVLWEAGAQPLANVLPVSPPAGVTLLIGPEGGLSDAEVARARAAGFHAVHLGPRILRTETAGLAVTPILQYLYGDWQQAPPEAQTLEE